MFLKTNLKIGRITNLSDARFAAGRGAAFAGFNFTPGSTSYLEPEKAQEIIGWLDGPKLVGEWDNGISETIWDTAERLQLDYIQLNWIDAGLGSKLQDWNIIQQIDANLHIDDIIKQIDITQPFTDIFMFALAQDTDTELYMQSKLHVQMLQSVCRDYPVILCFPFSTQNLLPILDELKPFGINLDGGKEIKPGYKDFDLLNDLVDLIELED